MLERASVVAAEMADWISVHRDSGVTPGEDFFAAFDRILIAGGEDVSDILAVLSYAELLLANVMEQGRQIPAIDRACIGFAGGLVAKAIQMAEQQSGENAASFTGRNRPSPPRPQTIGGCP